MSNPPLQPSTTSDSIGFLTIVPANHIRIMWRGKYYHLLEGHTPQVVSAQAEPQVKLEPKRPNPDAGKSLGACTDLATNPSSSPRIWPPCTEEERLSILEWNIRKRERGGNTQAPFAPFLPLYLAFVLGALTSAVTAPLFLQLFSLFR